MHGSKQVKEGNSELLIRSSEPKEYVHLERKWVGGYASSLKLNLTDPCRTVPWLRDARLAGWVTYCRICTSTKPKTGQNKVQLFCKDDWLLYERNY